MNGGRGLNITILPPGETGGEKKWDYALLLRRVNTVFVTTFSVLLAFANWGCQVWLYSADRPFITFSIATGVWLLLNLCSHLYYEQLKQARMRRVLLQSKADTSNLDAYEDEVDTGHPAPEVGPADICMTRTYQRNGLCSYIACS